MNVPILCGVNIREFAYIVAFISWGKSTEFCTRVRPIYYGGKLQAL